MIESDRSALWEFQRGQSLQQAGRAREAIAAHRRALELDENLLVAGIGLCQSLQAAGENAEALTVCRGLADRWPEQPGPKIVLGALLLASGRLDAAESVLIEVASRRPDIAAVHVHLARCARLRGKLEEALVHVRTAQQWEPHDMGVRTAYAELLRDTGQAPAAEAEFRGILATAPGWGPALHGLVTCLRVRGELEEALSTLDAAGELPLAPLWRADLLRDLGRLDEAALAYQKVTDEKAELLHAWIGRIHCARARRDPRGALAVTEQALLRHPANPALLRSQASLLLEGSEPARACAIYECLLRQSPEDVDLGIGLARGRYMTGQAATARDELDQLLHRTQPTRAQALFIARLFREWGCADLSIATVARFLPGSGALHSEFLVQLGLAEIDRGNAPAAIDAFRTAVEHDGHLIASLHLENAYRASGDEPRSREILQDLVRRHAELPGDVLAILAERAFAAMEHDLAVELAEEAYNRKPPIPHAAIMLARMWSQDGRLPEALALLREADPPSRAKSLLAAIASQLLRQHGRLDEARATVLEALQADPRSNRLLFELGAICFDRGELDAARAAAARIVPANLAEVVERQVFEASLHLLEWRSEAALALLAQTLEMHPSARGAHQLMATASLSLLRIDAFRIHLDAITRIDLPDRILKGLPRHRSQSHFGQLYDEFTLDRSSLRRLDDACALEPPNRRLALARQVRERPDYTPAAIALLVDMRRAGDFSRAMPGGSTIPSRICQYWDTREVPADVAALMDSWTQHNPDYAYHQFDDVSARAFIASHCAPAVSEAFERADLPAMKADLFRLAWLWHEGGWYADADDRCRTGLARWSTLGAELVLWQEPFGTIGNNFIGARPRHPLLAAALEHATEAINRGDGDILWLRTGPGVMTRTAAAAFAVADPMPGTLVLTELELAAILTKHCMVSYKRSDQHWRFATRRPESRLRPPA